MFEKLFTKIGTFADHHQVLIAIAVALSVICVSWGIEQILEQYVFHKKPLFGYLSMILLGALVLFLVQHYVLHVI